MPLSQHQQVWRLQYENSFKNVEKNDRKTRARWQCHNP